MDVETGWVGLPKGVSASYGRMASDGSNTTNNDYFSLADAALMNIEAFNMKAKKYDIHIDENDPPIDRMVKVAVYHSRATKGCDDSHIPTNREYVDMLLAAAANKKADPTMRSLYEITTGDIWDATCEILVFNGKSKKGYSAKLLRFNEKGELFIVDDDVQIPVRGWIRILDAKYGLPMETSEEEGIIENIEIKELRDCDMKGYWYLAETEGDMGKLIIRDPVDAREGLLFTDAAQHRSWDYADMIKKVGALRLK